MAEDGVHLLDFVLEENPTWLARTQMVAMVGYILPLELAEKLLEEIPEGSNTSLDESTAIRDLFQTLSCLNTNPLATLMMGGLWRDAGDNPATAEKAFAKMEVASSTVDISLYYSGVQIFVGALSLYVEELQQDFSVKHDGLTVKLIDGAARIGRYS